MTNPHPTHPKTLRDLGQISDREQILLNALSKIGEKTYSMGCVYVMDGVVAADYANKAIYDWAQHAKN